MGEWLGEWPGGGGGEWLGEWLGSGWGGGGAFDILEELQGRVVICPRSN